MNMELQCLLGTILSQKFVCIDVGARGGLGYPWAGLKSIVEGVYFEADREEQKKLQASSKETVFPYALSKKCGKYNLNLTSSRPASSLLFPNHKFFSMYPENERMNVDKIVECECTTIDSLYEEGILEKADFIKLDTQGSELDIIKGGKFFLSTNVLGIEVEVSFRELYKNQAFFRDVDKYISEEFNMELVDIQKSYWKYSEGLDIGQRKGAVIFGNALYFRSPDEIIKLCESAPTTAEKKDTYVMALIMYLAYGYIDYSLRLIRLGRGKEILEEDTHALLENTIKDYAKTFMYKINKTFSRGSFRRKAFLIGKLLAAIFDPKGGGWNNWESNLGSKKKWKIFF